MRQASLCADRELRSVLPAHLIPFFFPESELPMICRFCYSRDMHSSRWQAQDIFMLPLLMFPMRCHSCTRRDYRSLLLILWSQSENRERQG